MPFGVRRPECIQCRTSDSSIWRKSEDGVMCIKCSTQSRDSPTPSVDSKTDTNKSEVVESDSRSLSSFVPLRKSSRIKPSRQRPLASYKSLPPKGKSRRYIFKKNPMKAPPPIATVLTSNYVFSEGIYWQRGDIASVMDVDGSLYYVQIRGFLTDQYCNKSAALTWLLPTTGSPKDRFDPSTFIIGPEEELPRPMDLLEFVCHAPSDYFKLQHSPYPLQDDPRSVPPLAYINTRLGPQIMAASAAAEMFDKTPPRERHITPAEGHLNETQDEHAALPARKPTVEQAGSKPEAAKIGKKGRKKTGKKGKGALRRQAKENAEKTDTTVIKEEADQQQQQEKDGGSDTEVNTSRKTRGGKTKGRRRQEMAAAAEETEETKEIKQEPMDEENCEVSHVVGEMVVLKEEPVSTEERDTAVPEIKEEITDA